MFKYFHNNNAHHLAACVITLLASSSLPTEINHFGDSGNMKKYARYNTWGIPTPKQKLSHDLRK